MINEVKVQYLRSIFTEIVSFLNSNNFTYWVGGGLAEMIAAGVINDNAKAHDIDLHVLEAEHKRLKRILIDSGYKIGQEKDYKIRLLKDSNQRGIEFVFLTPSGQDYAFKSRDIVYKLPQKLFTNDTVKIGDITVRIPGPVEDYVETRRQQKAENKFRQ